MLPLQTLLISLTGFFWPPICLTAMPPPDEPVVVCVTVTADGSEVVNLANPVTAACDAGIVSAGPAGNHEKTGVVVVKCADDETVAPGQRIKVQALASDGGPGRKIVVRSIGSGVGEVADIEAGGPWLGIQFGPVPKPLAAHLKLAAETGQMVLNIVEGSPADQAGLTQYDVIVKLDGREAPADIKAFLDQVRGLQPGAACALGVIQAGDNRQLTLTVGERPSDPGPTKYKYETDLEELSQGRVFRRGGLMEKDEQGNWMFKDFDLPDMPDVFQWLPEDEDLMFDFRLPPSAGPGGLHTLLFKSEKSGSVKIERTGDGQIKVTRIDTDEDGDTRSTTIAYGNEDELKKGDPDAYELLSKCSGKDVLIRKLPGAAAPGLPAMRHEELLRQHLDEARKQTEDARKQLQAVRERVQREGRPPPALEEEILFEVKPRTSFEMLSDGRIRVIQRQGDTEAAQTFDSLAAMKAQRPDLHQKYEKLQPTDRGNK